MNPKLAVAVIAAAVIWMFFNAGPKPASEQGASQSAQAEVAAPPAPAPEPQKELSPDEKKAQQLQWHGSKTIVAAERAVRKTLKDPDSANFKGVYANYTEEFGVVACGSVNSKNGFGGYTGFKRFVSSGQSVIFEGRDNIGEAWADACL